MHTIAPITSLAPRQASSTPAAAPNIVGPLTTVTTFPATCSSWPLWYLKPDQYFQQYWPTQADCNPSGWTRRIPLPGSMVTYSPGICPSGWAAGGEITHSGVAATTAYCCPSGVPIRSSWAGDTRVCYTSITTEMTVTSSSVAIVTSDFSAFQWAIPIMWAESDLSKFQQATITASTSLASSVPTSVDSTSNGSTGIGPNGIATAGGQPTITTSTSPSTHHRGGLSTGAEAGIGVGAGVPLVALIAGLCFFFYRRGQRKAQRDSVMEIAGPFQDVASSPRWTGFEESKRISMVNTGIAAELSSPHAEIYHPFAPRSELEGSPRASYAPYQLHGDSIVSHHR